VGVLTETSKFENQTLYMAKQRLQKILSEAGVTSRRKAEEMILNGQIELNGEIVDSLPVFADPNNDDIRVNGRKLRFEPKVYYLLNKPRKVVSTSKDQMGRPTVRDLVPVKERVFCVGRLDTETTGLIILTNDNDLANKLTHPRYEVPKTYIATVKGRIDSEAVEKLKKGVRLAEGRTGPAAVRILRKSRDESLIEITIKRGMKRQIRRTLAKAGYTVKALKRTKIGEITDKGLGIGKFRLLTGKEVNYLKKLAKS